MEKKTYLLEQMKKLVEIPSPTGMTRAAAEYTAGELTALGFRPEITRKGTVVCELGGEGHPLLLTAHVDTLGLMVRSIKSNGRIRFVPIGGFGGTAVVTENVLVHTRSGKTYTGVVESQYGSRHVWNNKSETDIGEDSLEVLLDELVFSKEDTEKLGIRPGDYISLDPRFTYTESGFIKSRHLDDKAAAAMLLTLAREISLGNVKPARKVTIAFTVYEEVGHGASPFYASDAEDLIAVDMGCVGDDLQGSEEKLTLCAKDANGPYDKSFLDELAGRSDRLGLDYVVDVFLHYGSDAATALHAGLEARFACIGAGVNCSHSYERTHINSVMASLALVTDVCEKIL